VSTRARIILAVAVSAVLLAVAAGYAGVAAHRRLHTVAADRSFSVAPGDRLLVRSTAPGSLGRLATVDRADPAGRRLVSGVSCNRVYAAAGTALCLRPDGPLATYQLAILGPDLRERDDYPLVGYPTGRACHPAATCWRGRSS
jgi:hypothetical protein